MTEWTEPSRIGERYFYGGPEGIDVEVDRRLGKLFLTQDGERRFATDATLLDTVFAHWRAMLVPGSTVDRESGATRIAIGDAERVLALVYPDRVELPVGDGDPALLAPEDLPLVQGYDWRCDNTVKPRIVTTIGGRMFELGQVVQATGRPVAFADGDSLNCRRSNVRPAPHPNGLDNFAIHPNGCWLWQGEIARANGFALLKIGGENKYVRKLVWEQRHGPLVRHFIRMTCDREHCVNPNHMTLCSPTPAPAPTPRRRTTVEQSNATPPSGDIVGSTSEADDVGQAANSKRSISRQAVERDNQRDVQHRPS